MTTTRRWYERTLGSALVLIGLVCVLAPVYVWVWVDHVFAAIAISVGLLSGLGGIVLLRRA